MCGIAGIINRNKNIVDDAELKRMTDVVAHRGPDGEGFYSYKNLGFGHRRLSIIDLSKAGHQPKTLGDDYIITFNGEVYNYIELREELKKLGHQFFTQTDTEVILVAYKEWGAACVTKFNGMWAFAIHDVKKQIVFCSRDRFGIKPFFYTTIGSKFISSEMLYSSATMATLTKYPNLVNEIAFFQNSFLHRLQIYLISSSRKRISS